TPRFEPSQQLDFELEVGFIVGTPNHGGAPIPASAAAEHIFGFVLLNDWSARDLQAWEGQPLGPFLSKSFATSLSPWVVTLDALEPFRVSNRVQEPPPLDYLRTGEPWAFDIALEVLLSTRRMRAERLDPAVISTVNFRHMYWNAAQQLAHLTSNGTHVRSGDLCGSGTVSGTEPGTYGSLLELTRRGAEPLHLPGGETRAFLENGDTIIMRGAAQRPGVARVGFGEVRGTVSA
ncbi:MAG: fumarylacetoacetate hydrolase family protein, partial [Candidatus Eremiobacteraeota bacterium]|nr:fumarylacetoacetate hydrolase family protein [Candidatus Eremiobacteraeota bacterium]